MTSPRRPVISAWSAVSGFGIGRSAFRDGLAAGMPTDTDLDPERWDTPDERACLVPGFDVRAELGRKGTRSMDRATALAVTAVGRLLGEERATRGDGAERGTGLVLGTTTGSAQSIMDFTRDSIEGDKPFFVDPARFPNTVMNCAAGQCAIWYGLRGPNATVAGGRLAGLHALNYATRLLRGGRAETVLCGSVEEYSHARAWLEHRGRVAGTVPAPLGEGCAVWQVGHDPADAADAADAAGPADPEDEAGDDGYGARDASEGAGVDAAPGARAEVLGVRFGAIGSDGAAAALTRVTGRALAQTGVAARDLWAIVSSRAPGALGEAEDTALRTVLADARPRRIVPAELLGDGAAVSAAFQVSAALATAERDPAAAGRPVLITALDPEGAVGCALLSLR